MATSAYRFESPQDARSFDSFSVANAAAVLAAIQQRGCSCQPYEDVFTFQRWIAQGRAVRKGEHGIRLPVIVERSAQKRNDETGEEETRTYRLWRLSHVFCRCQTDPIAARIS